MHSHHDYLEEERLGKALDIRLLHRLLAYVRPQAGLFLAAFLLAGGITLVELALPYITKTAIDSVLTPPWIAVRAEAPPIPEAIPLGEGRFLVKEGALPQGVREELERAGAVEGRYLLIPPDGPGDGIAARHPDLFRTTPEGYVVAEGELERLSADERLALRGSALRTLLYLVLGLLALLLIRFALSYGQVYLLQYAGQRIMFAMRRDIFRHVLRLPMSFLDRQPVGRLVTRATNDVAAINEMYTQVVVYLVQDALMMAGVLAIMFRLNARLALLLLVFGPPLLLLAFWFRRRARDAYREARRKLARLNAYLAESISGMPIIQLFRQELRSFRAFQEINRGYWQAQMRSIIVYGIFGPAISVMRNLALALLIWYGGRGVLSGTFTLGALVAFTSYVRMLFQPLSDLSDKYNILQSAMAASERIFKLLDEKEEPTGSRPLAALQGEIEFKDVWFAYRDEDWVLKGISFHIVPGERVALVGPTGSGKSTIVNLLFGFYRPQRGKILVDGNDIRELDLSQLRRSLAVVPQDAFLFSGNVEENIRLWEEKLSPDGVRQAAEAAGVHGMVKRLPEGYSTEVRERGGRLSVGERQLLSIARAVAADPKLIVLDEATANVDSHTEAQVQKALERLMAGRTVLAIAHRLSTIRNVDRVLVLSQGRLVEEGTVEELLARRGLFWALWQLQFASPARNPEGADRRPFPKG
ncbi:ABC transporter ATP-binding protein [Candidatus Bipolaricaulota bacterium]|nr:ABC transporter ATP-binding protein [Candidatus Bipolaricaulota bacterium]